MNPDPTVPSLYVTDHTDTTITATWKYNTDFEYELMYSKVEDIQKAKGIPIILPEDQLDPKYPQNGVYFDVVVEDLFPLTTYYFWVRAKKIDNSGVSQWSNPASIQTKDAIAPLAPRGVGLAPELKIKPYGYTSNVTEEHLIIEWIKDIKDEESEDTLKVKKQYTYIIELSDNPKFIDPQYVESAGGSEDKAPSNVEILEKSIVKFGELVPNREYYIRMKTRLTITGSEPNQLIVKESLHYTIPIRILTLATGNDYDGYNDPALSVLPEENYEQIYDEETQILTFRFRDDKKDNTGASDNQVDQRLISEIIEQHNQSYVINLNSFSDKPIKKRIITIPYSILEAFNTYHVTLKILADDILIDLPVASIINPVKEQVHAYGVAPQVKIAIEKLNENHVIGDIAESGLKTMATPYKLGIQVISDRKIQVIDYTDSPITIRLKTTSRYALYNSETVIYIKDAKSKWVKNTNGKYDRYNGRMVFNTWDIGSYGIYNIERVTEIPDNRNASHWSENNRKAVYSNYTINGLYNYDPEGNVTGRNILQAIYGLVAKEDTINLSNQLDSQKMITLERSNLKQGVNEKEEWVSREMAISMFVRSYELLHSKIITADLLTYNQALDDIQIASEYKKSMAKAKEIGLISTLENLRPKDKLRYGEFFTLWSRIMEE